MSATGAARLPKVVALAIAASLLLGLLALARGLSPSRQRADRMDAAPRRLLWAWQRPEDLRFLDAQEAGVAFWAGSVSLSGDDVEVVHRRQELVTSPAASEKESLEAGRRAARMDQLNGAPMLLGRWVLEWAQVRPAEARLPEALHRVVWSTRWGCVWEAEVGPVSKAAFVRLHRDFPNDPWTAKTPYWFD